MERLLNKLQNTRGQSNVTGQVLLLGVAVVLAGVIFLGVSGLTPENPAGNAAVDVTQNEDGDIEVTPITIGGDAVTIEAVKTDGTVERQTLDTTGSTATFDGEGVEDIMIISERDNRQQLSQTQEIENVQPIISASRSVADSEVGPGETTEVTVTVSAETPSDLTVTEDFSPAFENVSVVDADGADVSAGTDTLTAEWDDVENAELVYEVTVPSSASDGDNYTIASPTVGVTQVTVNESVSSPPSEINDLSCGGNYDLESGDPCPDGVNCIYDQDDFETISSNPNEDYILMNDIDVNGNIVEQGLDTDGTFHGNGYAITDYTIDKDLDRVGLFYISNGTICNLSVDGDVTGNSKVGLLVGETGTPAVIKNVDASGSVTGDDNVTMAGGVVGASEAHIKNVSSDATVNGNRWTGGVVGWAGNTSPIEQTYFNGTVTGSDQVGGIAGITHAEMTENHAAGTVNGTDEVGGVAGYASYDINNSYSTADIDGNAQVGGVVGLNHAKTENVYAAADVNGGTDVGAIAGENGWSDYPFYDDLGVGSVSNAYWDGDVMDEANGVATNTTDDDDKVSTTELTTDEMTGEDAESNMSSFDFGDIWTTTSDYPEVLE